MAEDSQSIADERLLQALAEELKLPLMQIARQTDLIDLAGNVSDIWLDRDLAHISVSARAGLRLLDGFLLSSRLQALGGALLEPVSLSSVLADAAHKLEPLAKQNNCDVLVSLSGKYKPAMAHRRSLDTALLLLGYSVIEGFDGQVEQRVRREVTLGVHKSAHGLVTGVFDSESGLNPQTLRSGRTLYGYAGQAMPAVSSTGSAGIFVADSLMRSMSAPLRVARHKKLIGLASTFHPSQQMQLI